MHYATDALKCPFLNGTVNTDICYHVPVLEVAVIFQRNVKRASNISSKLARNDTRELQ